MTTQRVHLLDDSGNTVATAEIANEGSHFGGTIDLSHTPAAVRALFGEFEEIVNGQIFSLVDEIQERIAAACPRARFANDREVELDDLQVYPETGAVSFRLKSAAGASTVNGAERSKAIEAERSTPQHPS